jgi:D-alanyl-D-alanine carboxypeptidase
MMSSTKIQKITIGGKQMDRRQFLVGGGSLCVAFAMSACSGGGGAQTRESLRLNQAKLDVLLSDFLRSTGVPGATIALIASDEHIVSLGGVRVLGKPEKIQVNDAFHVGSNAKSMLAMLVMRSVELGELKLETPIYDLLPSLKSTGLPIYAKVTLEQLLSHRAGIEPLLDVPSIEEGLPVFEGSAVEQRRQALVFLTSREPAAAPGAAFLYSNGSYACAAAVLEAVTGKSYERLLQERLFTPLGIKGAVGWPGQSVAAAPYGHYFVDGQFVAFEPEDPRAAFRAALTPAGNVSMSIGDYSSYLRAHLSALRGGNLAALERSSYERLHRAIPGTEFGYALGWATDGKDKQGQQVDYHYGSTDIFGCFALLQPAKDRAVAVIVNGEKPPFEEPISSLAYAILALLD